MKLFSRLLVLGLAGHGVVASTWFSKAVYNKWHQTELERWLSDNDIPFPSPADRKDLENLVKENWQGKVVSPYNEWDTTQLQNYIQEKGIQVQETAKDNKEGLITHVKSNWYEVEDKAEEAWSSVKNWIFDSWSDSQLKTFADKHDIPVPQPRTRDTLLSKVRSSYESIAEKLGESIAYPGNWLYASWSDSDLKTWLDTHGVPAPQPSSRDKLIASVRRNSRVASLKLADKAVSASASAAAAAETISEQLLDSWSDSQIKEWADRNGIKVPQGSKRNELIAIARKHKALLTGDQAVLSKVSASAASAASKASASGESVWGAATSSAGNQYAKATDNAQLMASNAFNSAISLWSDTRLKAYLDARSIPVPQNGKRDELLASVRKNAHKAASGWTAWTYDDWTVDNLKSYLADTGDATAKAAAEKAGATREELVSAAQQYYSIASKSSGAAYASVTSYLAKQTDAAKSNAFDTWSESDLKAYADSYGIHVPQGSKKNELTALIRNQVHYFRYGTSTPQETLWANIKNGAQWILDSLSGAAASGSKSVQKGAQQAGDYVAEGITHATNVAAEKAQAASHLAQESAQQAAHKAKEEL